MCRQLETERLLSLAQLDQYQHIYLHILQVFTTVSWKPLSSVTQDDAVDLVNEIIAGNDNFSETFDDHNTTTCLLS